MNMQISQISLYGKNGHRRDIKFNIGSVNIITGASKKGKSSLLEIVEYCLGSSECTIAEGCIRETVSWFSILLQFPDTQVFIARAVPLAGAKSSSAACLIVSNVVPIPTEISQTTNIDSVVKFLTSKTGIPENTTEVPAEQTRSRISIGFKHSRYYLFQGQDEIAAKKTLFHRQAEPHIPQAIIDTMPYFLGAAKDDRLSEIEKLRTLKQDKARLNKRLNELESLKGSGLEKGYALLAQAIGVGLYEETNKIPGDEQLLRSLKSISEWAPENNLINENVDDPVVRLEKRQRELTEEKSIVRSRLKSATEYQNSADGFEGAVSEQTRRLQSIGLFKRIDEPNNDCPLCGGHHEKSSKYEGIVNSALADLSSKLEGVERSRPRVASLVSELQLRNKSLADEIKKTRIELDGIASIRFNIIKSSSIDIIRAKIVGKISLYLDSVDWNDDSAGLIMSLNKITDDIEELERKLDPEALKETLDSQLSIIAEDMTKWARELELEHSENRIRLDPKKLTVVAETSHGLIPLYKMGSGENWVGYHLVTYLAFAKWFIENNRPVGNFIFIDQPTQVYFPADTAATGNISEIKKDEDRDAVRKMFLWIFRIVKEMSPNLQVIITDHADIDEDWFQSAVRDVKWRGDSALIPASWIK